MASHLETPHITGGQSIRAFDGLITEEVITGLFLNLPSMLTGGKSRRRDLNYQFAVADHFVVSRASSGRPMTVLEMVSTIHDHSIYFTLSTTLLT